MLIQRLISLYKKAIAIEEDSQSQRVKSAHCQNKSCQIGLGTYWPDSTKYMFVSLNPGGEEYTTKQLDAEKLSSEHLPIEQYLEYSFPFARNMKKIISAFAEFKNITFEDASKQFGTTDFSFFHSKTSSELRESFYIEVKESLPVLIEEISIPKLTVLIFSGVKPEHFFYNLYKTGSEINDYSLKDTGQDGITAFRTTLINNREYYSFFITHISATRGLKNETLVSIGNELAKLI